MRHGLKGRKLNRQTDHRQAMFANMATSLLRHEMITTTLPKAKDLRRVVEPLITKARDGDLAARRHIMKTVKDEAVVRKLMDDLAVRFKERPGGYTRIVKAGFRKGDAAPMAIIELTDRQAPATEEAPKAKEVVVEAEAKEVKTEEKPAKKAAPKKEASAEKKAPAKKPAAKKATAKKDEEAK